MGFCSSFAMSLIFTVNMVYQATVVQLTPFQLVLMGTILEATTFAFEIPTGVLADVKSRRLSIVIGYIVMGLGFVLEGAIASLWAVAAAQVIWGLGYTFTSGATQAWIVDEAGPAAAGHAFLSRAQTSQWGNLVAIPASIGLGYATVTLPIVLGGLLLVALGVGLAVTMTEDGFSPTRAENRTTLNQMARTVRDARLAVRRQPILLTLLGIGLFYGLYSEGLDRLWTPHLLEDFSIPAIGVIGPVVWLGAIRGLNVVLSLLATGAARRRIDARQSRTVWRILTIVTASIAVFLAAVGLVRSIWAAILLLLVIGALRAVHSPLYETWVSARIDDPQVRATLFSVSSQTDALGQIAGGPIVGAIANRSIRTALVASAAMLAPAVPLYFAAIHREGAHAPAPSTQQ
jgi:DHA3 family tetracycline resistance protein-like MFS transporter